MATEIERARALLAAGKPQDAYRAVSGLCSQPDPFADCLPAAVALLGDLARAFGDAELAQLFDTLRARPEAPGLLYKIAYQFYEQRQYATASGLLYRANALAPGQVGILAELAGALEHQLRYGEAALLLELSGLATTDPFCIYIAGFSWLMVGDLDRARPAIDLLAAADDPRIQFMRNALAAMIARADALVAAGIALDDRALTAWQAALDGTVLLHESPHGYPDPMRGRYAFLADSAGAEREGLERIRAVLAARGTLPPRIIGAPDRASRILGLAASRIFGVPCEPWRPGDHAPGLVVAWSLESVDDPDVRRELHDHHPRQSLFVHASSWTQPFVYAPDATTLLHQVVTNPWTGGAMLLEPPRRAEPDARSDDDIAAEIANAEIRDPSVSSLDAVIAIARVLDTLLEPQRGGLGRTAGKRIHQRIGSPVPSNRFT